MDYLWRIEMLGGLRAVRNPSSTGSSTPVVVDRFRTQKTAALLAFLAFHSKPQPREVLIELLWPDQEINTGRQNLRTALSSLRRQLEPPGVPAGAVLLATHLHVQLNTPGVISDVAEFEAALDEARRVSDADARIALYKRTVELYAGPLLPGFYDEWVMHESDRLAAEYFDALARLITHYESQRETVQARHFAALGARMDNAPEAIITAFERLGGEMEASDVLPKKRRRTVHPEDLKPVGGSPAIIASSVAAQVSLPLQFTRFFGREAEIEQIDKELTERQTRLLTLTGAGGSGKTRLAIEAARQWSAAQRADIVHAVYFVPLAEVREASQVAPAIANAIDLRRVAASSEPGSSHETVLCERIVAVLASKSTLLVLDNFEHVTGASLLLESLLQRVENLHLLVTSQHRLQVAGEREIPVTALPTPDDEDEFEQICQAPSVQLFVDRAQLTRPDFQITQHNAQDIAQLCITLEGVPLAIELAAARAGVLTPSQISTQLEAARQQEGGRLDFLKHPRRPATMRHLSLRTAINWSYGLLPQEMAKFWSDLAVFHGSFTPEATVGVCQQSGALHWLGHLRACSLLSVEERHGMMRFRWTELLHEFAEEQLEADAKHANEIHRRHAEYYCDLFADIVLRLRTPDEPMTLRQAASEADNARAAMTWAQSAQEYSLIATLSLSFGTTLQRRGLHREAHNCFENGLEAARQLPPEYDMLQASLLRECAGVHLDLMEWSHAVRDANLLRDLSARLDDAKSLADATNLLGLAAKSSGQWKRARTHFAAALEDFERLGDTVGIAHAHNNLGLIEYHDPRGNKPDAVVHLREALRLRWELSDARGVAETFINLGALAQQRGDLNEAGRYYDEALAIEARLAHIFGVGRALCNLGEIAEARNEIERAIRFYIAAQSIFAEAGIAYQEYSARRIEKLIHQCSKSTTLLEEARRLAQQGDIGAFAAWARG